MHQCHNNLLEDEPFFCNLLALDMMLQIWTSGIVPYNMELLFLSCFEEPILHQIALSLKPPLLGNSCCCQKKIHHEAQKIEFQMLG